MAIIVGVSFALEINPENAKWVGAGVLAGLVFGYYSAEENNATRNALNCAFFGGLLMGLVGNFFILVDSVESSNSGVKGRFSPVFLQKKNNKLGDCWKNVSEMLLETSCRKDVKNAAIDGAILGIVGGTTVGLLDCVLTALCARGESRCLIDRLIRRSIKWGLLGAFLGTLFSFIQCCF